LDAGEVALTLIMISAAGTLNLGPFGGRRMRKYLMIFMALSLAATIAAGVLYMRDLARARARLTGRSQTISTPFGDIEYALVGQGGPVMVVHSTAGGFDQGLDMIGPLANHGYRLIAPSRFGYLRSASPANLTAGMQADAYVALLDRLGVQKVSVVAISAGAWSSLQFAIRHPDRCQKLVLLVPANHLPPGVSIHGGALVRAIFNSDLVAWAAVKLMPVMPGGMTRTMLGTDPDVIRMAGPDEQARIRQLLEHLLPISPRIKGIEFDIKSTAIPELYAIEKISCPVLTISAADDAFGTAVRAKSIAADVPHGRAVIYQTGGHALAGHYEDVRREVASFLGEPRKDR
jgi:2-hydroxy-6-oxonona-2,4-dienedioate hydrolase